MKKQMSAQQAWNLRNREVIRQADRKYARKRYFKCKIAFQMIEEHGLTDELEKRYEALNRK